MKSLNILCKILKQHIDNKKKLLLDLTLQQQQIQNIIENLKSQLIEQQEVAAKNPEILFSYVNYASNNNQQQHNLKEELEKLTLQIELNQEELFQYYTKLKSYEIVIKNKQQQMTDEKNKQEEIQRDELIIQRFESK